MGGKFINEVGEVEEMYPDYPPPFTLHRLSVAFKYQHSWPIDWVMRWMEV